MGDETHTEYEYYDNIKLTEKKTQIQEINNLIIKKRSDKVRIVKEKMTQMYHEKTLFKKYKLMKEIHDGVDVVLDSIELSEELDTLWRDTDMMMFLFIQVSKENKGVLLECWENELMTTFNEIHDKLLGYDGP